MLNFSNLSYWEKIAVTESVDFIVIGAGLVGVSTAIELRKLHPSAKIVILERGYLPTGASTKNAGFACFGSATELVDDLNNIDENTVWETLELRYKGLNELLNLYGSDKIGYRLSGSWDLIHSNEQKAEQITREKLDYLNTKIFEITGERDCFSEDNESVIKNGFKNISTAFHNRLEGEIRTDKLYHALQQKLAENEIITLYGITVESIVTADNLVTVHTNHGELTSSKAAVTVNGFAKKLLNDNRIQPARAQVLVTSVIPNLKFQGTFHYDAGYYYFRNIDGRILIGGGRNLDFKAENTEEFGNTEPITTSIKRLLKTVIIPDTDFTIDYEWSGIMGVGNEKKPIIELTHPNVAIGVRMGGMGVAIGTLVGKKVAELLK